MPRRRNIPQPGDRPRDRAGSHQGEGIGQPERYCAREEVADDRSTGFSRNPGEQPPKGGTTNGRFPAARYRRSFHDENPSCCDPSAGFRCVPGRAEDRDQVKPRTKHCLLAIDNHWNRLLYLDECRPGKSWTIAIPAGSRDLQLVGDGKLLVSHGNGAAEYDLATGRKLKWVVERYTQINTARRLANGNTLLGADTAVGVVLYELDRDGKQIDRRQLKGLKDLRLLRPVENGNILMTVSGPCRAIEVDREGKIVWQAPLADKGYKAVRLANGNTMASTGGAATVVEFDRSGAGLYDRRQESPPEPGPGLVLGLRPVAQREHCGGQLAGTRQIRSRPAPGGIRSQQPPGLEMGGPPPGRGNYERLGFGIGGVEDWLLKAYMQDPPAPAGLVPAERRIGN